MGYKDTWQEGGRKCTGCEKLKPWDDFSPRKNGRNGRSSRCRSCNAATRKQYRQDNLQAVRASERAWERRVRRHTRRRYGISAQEWDERVAAQDGRCAVPACRREPRRRLVGDHCHVTGKFRGIICDNCNVAMGLTGDDPEVLRGLADWISSAT